MPHASFPMPPSPPPCRLKPPEKQTLPGGRLRRQCYRLVNSRGFEMFILSIILINVGFLAASYYHEPPSFTRMKDQVGRSRRTPFAHVQHGNGRAASLGLYAALAMAFVSLSCAFVSCVAKYSLSVWEGLPCAVGSVAHPPTPPSSPGYAFFSNRSVGQHRVHVAVRG